MTRRVLYLDAHRLTTYHWSQQQVRKEAVFEATGEDLEKFVAYLKRHAGCRFYLLANTPEEGYQQETIPFLHGANRRALLNRKLSQYFFATPLTAARSLGFEKDRRKNEKLLLSGLTNPTHFEAWLSAIRHAEAILAGIYTPAQLCGPLLSRLEHSHERCLLLTVQDNSIRESFVVDGITHFSRMAPLHDTSHVGMASTLATEAGKLHQYLLGQRLIGRNERLNTYVLAHPLAAKAIETSCIDSGGLTFIQLDSHAASKQLGLKSPPEDSRAEAIFVHLLATRPPAQQYAPETFRRDYRLSQARYVLWALAALALLAAAVFSGAQHYRAYSAHHEAAQLARHEVETQQRYQALTGTFPKIDASNEELRQVTERYISLQGKQRGLEAIFHRLSRGLEAHPDIEIDQIEWKQNAERSAAGATPSDPAGVTETALISGAVRPTGNATPRQTIARFTAFVEALRLEPGTQVLVLQSPYDIESGRALKGSGREEETLKQHPFALRIERKGQP